MASEYVNEHINYNVTYNANAKMINDIYANIMHPTMMSDMKKICVNDNEYMD